MSYKVDYSKSVIKTISKMDLYTKKIILNWIGKHLVGCEDPRKLGKPLVGDKKGQWHKGVHDPEFVAKHVYYDED